jgi:hypothetical protein
LETIINILETQSAIKTQRTPNIISSKTLPIIGNVILFPLFVKHVFGEYLGNPKIKINNLNSIYVLKKIILHHNWESHFIPSHYNFKYG